MQCQIFSSTHHITSHHISPHHITPHHITSHPITPHHTPSHHSTAQHSAAHHTTPHHITPHNVTAQRSTARHQRLVAYPSDADHDVARVQVGVHKVVSQQHLEVGVHPQRDNLCVEGAGLPNILGHTLTYKQSQSSRPSHWSIPDVMRMSRSWGLTDVWTETVDLDFGHTFTYKQNQPSTSSSDFRLTYRTMRISESSVWTDLLTEAVACKPALQQADTNRKR